MNKVFALLTTLFLAGCQQSETSTVRVVGAMRNVMMRGDLTANIDLDTIQPRKGLYGIGPADSLRGELMIYNGIIYRSVVKDSSMIVSNDGNLRAPFFVYATVNSWKEYPLSDSVSNLVELDAFLDEAAKGKSEPFAFILEGSIDSAVFHVVNVPVGTTISTPSDVNRNQLTMTSRKQEVRLVGFFSRDHKGVFTHHDSQVHIHLITSDAKLMGHLDALAISTNMKLLLPF